MDSNKIPLNIYLDWLKAFETLNHDILLDKLEQYGIRDTELLLVLNYLLNRKQSVKLVILNQKQTILKLVFPKDPF